MSKFLVSARKYRPAIFDEVIGQNHVAKTLKNALQSDKLAHAFLFCGPRGVGKTTCARILAKVINCENPVDKVDPCNECSSCKSFNENASFNIIELDAASNNKVEHIRTLIEQVRFQPQHGTHKVFIIDEVHMLSAQAFNAFLKTLEEPPPYAIFILATTEKHRIIPTILSRCQIFDFKRIQVNDAVEQLKFICEQEGKKADQEALHLIGQKADGAMRDALSIYDKIASATAETITYKDVISNLNILDYDYYFKVVDAFLKEDLSSALLILDEVFRFGFEPEQFIEGLSNHLRDLLVCKDGRTINLLDVSDKLKSRYQHQAALTNKSVLLSGLDILNQCDVNLPRAKNKRLYTEIALSKINFVNRAVEVNLLNVSSEEKKTPQVTSLANNTNDNSTPIGKEDKKVTPVEERSKQEDSTNESDLDISQEDKVEEKKEVPAPNGSIHLKSETVDNKPEATSLATDQQEIEKKPESKVNTKASDLIASFSKLGGIDDILETVKKDEEELKEARKGLNIENIQQIWNSYAQNVTSPSTKLMLELAKLTLVGKRIDVILPSPLYATKLVEEETLAAILRKEVGTSDLVINPIINRDEFPDMEIEKPKALLTTKERYKIMVEKHPQLQKLVDGLELKADT